MSIPSVSEYNAKKVNMDGFSAITYLGSFVTNAEAKRFRTMRDPIIPNADKDEKTVIRKEVMDLLESEQLLHDNSWLAALVLFAKGKSAAEKVSPFSVMNTLRQSGYSYVIVDAETITAKPASKRIVADFPDTGRVYEFSRKYGSDGGETLYLPIENGIPNTNFIGLGELEVVPFNSVVASLSQLIAHFCNVSAGVISKAVIDDNTNSLFGFNKMLDASKFSAMLDLLMGPMYFNLLGSGRTLQGGDLAHEIYVRMMNFYMTESLIAKMQQILKLIASSLMPVSVVNGVRTHFLSMQAGGELKVTYFKPTMPNAVKGVKLERGSATALQAFNALSIARPIRGDNKTKKGEMTNSMYLEGICFPREADVCYLATDLRDYVKDSDDIYVRLPTNSPGAVMTMLLKALVILDFKGIVHHNSNIGVIPGLKVTGAVAANTLTKYARYEYGTTGIIVQYVNATVIGGGICDATKYEIRSGTLAIDLVKKEDDAKSAVSGIAPTGGAGLREAVHLLNRLGCRYVTRTYMYEGILDTLPTTDDTDNDEEEDNDEEDDGKGKEIAKRSNEESKRTKLYLRPSCEYHNVTGWVSTIPTDEDIYQIGRGNEQTGQYGMATYYFKSVLCNFARTAFFLTGYRPYVLLKALKFHVPEVVTAGIGELNKIEFTLTDLDIESLSITGGLIKYLESMDSDTLSIVASTNPAIKAHLAQKGTSSTTTGSTSTGDDDGLDFSALGSLQTSATPPAKKV